MILPLFLLVAVILIVMQTTCLQFFPEIFGRPDLVFVIVAFAAYRLAWLPGIILSFAASWTLEVLTSIHLGLYSIQCLIVFACLKAITGNIPIKEWAYQIPFTALAYVFFQMFSYFTSSLINQEQFLEWNWLSLFRNTLWVALCALFFFPLFSKLITFAERLNSRSRPAAKQVNRQVLQRRQ